MSRPAYAFKQPGLWVAVLETIPDDRYVDYAYIKAEVGSPKSVSAVLNSLMNAGHVTVSKRSPHAYLYKREPGVTAWTVSGGRVRPGTRAYRRREPEPVDGTKGTPMVEALAEAAKKEAGVPVPPPDNSYYSSAVASTILKEGEPLAPLMAGGRKGVELPEEGMTQCPDRAPYPVRVERYTMEIQYLIDGTKRYVINEQ